MNLRFISSEQLTEKRRNVDLLEELNGGLFSEEQLGKLAVKHRFWGVLVMSRNDVLIALNNYVKDKVLEI